MKGRRFWVAAGILACAIIVGFAFSVPHARDLGLKSEEQASSTPAAPAVSLHDSYKKGVHTISGTLDAPDACATATSSATLLGDASTSESIELDIEMPPTAGVCLMLPTPVAFSATLAAPPDLPIEASVNGAAASTTLL